MTRPESAGGQPPARVRTRRDGDEGNAPGLRRVGASVLCAALVLVAVGLELAAGQGANSPEDARFAVFVPLGWPAPVRAVWWLLVAGAAASHRLLWDERRGVRRYVLAGLAAAPFALFALGIVGGAGWSTWH